VTDLFVKNFNKNFVSVLIQSSRKNVRLKYLFPILFARGANRIKYLS